MIASIGLRKTLNPPATRARKRLCIWCAAPTELVGVDALLPSKLERRRCTECHAVYAIAKEPQA